MLNMNNLVILRGNLGDDPILRETRANVPVTNFNLATNEYYKDSSGKRQQRVEWHKVTVFGTCAELCCQYLEKGQEVTIMGKLQTRKWKNQMGQECMTTEIHTTNVQFGRKSNKDYGDEGEFGEDLDDLDPRNDVG